MGILDFLTGEFIDVIHWTDDTRDTMVWRFDREDHEIKYGAKLTVRESQAAVFVHEGQLADVFRPGLYMLETNNMPILTTLQHWDHGFRSPFKSEVYFVSTRRFTNLKWGTKNPIMIRDPEFGPTRIRAYGTYTVKVTDPGKFLVEIVGTDGEFTMDEISYQIRNIIVQEFSRVISSSAIPVLDMAANTKDLGKLVAEAISETIAAYGIELPELYIENISLPPAVEKALDERTSRGLVGSLDDHFRYKTAEAMGHPGSGAGEAMSMGMGAGMGMAMGGAGPWGRAPAAPTPPPPPPVEHVWHVSAGGETTGPFSKADLGQMAVKGDLTRESWVWTPGQDGWLHAEDTELAELFTVAPPPPPTDG
ncbi:MAG: SPFH domain-containing protein [Pseudomonadota bacterium]